jgi:putative membrane protein
MKTSLIPLSLVGLAALACGGESTPEPRTQQSVTTTEGPPPGSAAYGSTAEGQSASASGMLPSDAPQPTGTPPGGPGLSNDQMRAAGTLQQEAPPPAPLTDQQVAAIADAANTGEVEQAKVAQKRAKDPRVKKFAAMMISHHTQAKQKQSQVLGKAKITPEQSPESTALTTEGTQVVESLKSIDAASFDAAYIASQVDAHQKVLNQLDTRLIPSAKNPELRASLEEFRPKVEAHLKEAREIQQALPAAKTSMGTGAASGSTATASDGSHR